MPPFLSIVIPAYNEARRLPVTLNTILDYLATQAFEAEIIVVDDGSTDGTADRVNELSRAYPHLRLVRNDHRGKGYTVRTGILLAQGRYVLFTDADLAVPMSEWPKLAAPLMNGYDVTIGSREGLGARRIGEPRYRHFMGRVFNGIVRLVALDSIQDTQCGFKAFRRDVAQHIFSNVHLYGADAKVVTGAAVTAFDVEVLFLARKFGYQIKEVPVTWQYGEETKVDPARDSWRNFMDVLRVRWNDARGRYAAGIAVSKKTVNK